MRRIIEQELVNIIDSRLKSNPIAQAYLKADNFRGIVVEGGSCLVGTREATGKNDGPIIRLVQETVGSAVGEPYCVGGVQSMIAYAELKTGKKSPLVVTELAIDLWYRTPAELRVKQIPLPGAIAVWQDVNNGKKKITGHAEIVRAAANSQWWGIGFNTSGSTYPGGPVVREGNGIYFTSRNYASTSKRIFLGFVKPI